ncbi:MAG: hypothetical protein ACJAT5_000605 [Lentimonas sp.]|jgi:hypothetical protein
MVRSGFWLLVGFGFFDDCGENGDDLIGFVKEGFQATGFDHFSSSEEA